MNDRMEALRDERNQALQMLADIHIMVMGRETDLATEIAMKLEADGWTTDAGCLWPRGSLWRGIADGSQRGA